MNETATRSKSIIFKILFIIFLIIFLAAAGLWLFENYKNRQAEKKFDELSNMTIDTQTESEEPSAAPETEESTIAGAEVTEPINELEQLGITVPEKNMDWEALKAENEHIYAWIYIPDTNVDYPILQHPDETSYYLKRGLDKKESTAGCIFSQYFNTKDFTDAHTVLYGHNMKNKSMFATLHKFESLDFFENHPYMYVYTPDNVLVYEIFASYKRDDQHLLLSYNWRTEESFQAYVDSIFSIRDMSAHFRDGVEVTGKDKILTLSTCVGGEATNRYLVQGVLLNPSALVPAEAE